MDRFSHPDPATIAALAETRARSLRTVETVFAGLVLACASAALAVHLLADTLAIAPQAAGPVSAAFLLLAIADLIMLIGCRAWLMRTNQ